jgi:hypothetical protein
MSLDTKENVVSMAASPPRVESNKGPSSNVRIVYVRVPELIFNHAKAQAYLSNMAFILMARAMSPSNLIFPVMKATWPFSFPVAMSR